MSKANGKNGEQTYKDYSRVSPTGSDKASTSSGQEGFGGGRSPNFPTKLHMILSNPLLSDGIITWLPHGRSWIVLDRDKFSAQILPRFFKTSHYASFSRQVNGWGFRRLSKSAGSGQNSYYHEFFLRGMPHLVKRMKRTSPSAKSGDAESVAMEGNAAEKKKQAKHPESEPDFDEISRLNPLPPVSGKVESADMSPSHGGGIEATAEPERESPCNETNVKQELEDETHVPPNAPQHPNDHEGLLHSQVNQEHHPAIQHQQLLMSMQHTLDGRGSLFPHGEMEYNGDVPQAKHPYEHFIEQPGKSEATMQHEHLFHRALNGSYDGHVDANIKVNPGGKSESQQDVSTTFDFTSHGMAKTAASHMLPTPSPINSTNCSAHATKEEAPSTNATPKHLSHHFSGQMDFEPHAVLPYSHGDTDQYKQGIMCSRGGQEQIDDRGRTHSLSQGGRNMPNLSSMSWPEVNPPSASALLDFIEKDGFE